MSVRLAICGMVMVVSIAGCARANPPKHESAAQSTMDALATRLAASEIAQVDIVEVPPRILTRVAFSPALLDANFQYRVTIRNVQGSVYAPGLLEGVKSATVQPLEEMPDLRWGVIFYDDSLTRLGAVYFDGSGQHGAVDSTAVECGGPLFRWLTANFAHCFR